MSYLAISPLYSYQQFVVVAGEFIVHRVLVSGFTLYELKTTMKLINDAFAVNADPLVYLALEGESQPNQKFI